MGAPCPEWAKRAWLEWVAPEVVWELYAGTESQAVTTVRGDDWLLHPGTVGPVTTGEMRVVDPETHEPVSAGVIGEIVMRPAEGTPPTYRYVGAEPRVLGDRWESLGDMGWFDAGGYLYLADRRADMILSGGANIYPAEIEAALHEHPAVQSCAVVGLPHEELGQSVHGIIQAVPDVPLPSDDELQMFIAERLVRYKVPRSFEWVDYALRDDAGKVRRSALREERAAS
jgi:bile acid-coenzyme A ligase